MPRRAPTSRGPSRREEILRASAELFAENGFRSVTLGQLGAAVGISGPGVYRHFARKKDVLAELLVEVSEGLLHEANRVLDGVEDPRRALGELICFHVEFATANAELIILQARELNSLEQAQQRRVRQLQRRYLELWAGLIAKVRGAENDDEALASAHAIFGLINSAPRLDRLPREAQRHLLSAMAKGALGLAS